nr:hypothetical protein [Tanacetum cinerariifolium]
EVARTEAQQLKIVLKRSRQQTHISQLGGFGSNEGTSLKPWVPNLPTDESEEELSWNSSDDEGADDQEKDDAEGSGDDNEKGSSDEEDDNEETRDEESFDPIPQTPESSEDEGDGEEDQGLNICEEERHIKEEEEDELYRDVNINQGRGLQASLEIEDSHVTLTPVKPNEPESASTPSETATKHSIGNCYQERWQTTSQIKEPSHLEFETGADNQPIVQSSQHPEWFSQPQKPPTLDRDWNKT